MSFNSSWRSPSNIALVKYWGKHGTQWPRNPSLSFTLSECVTEMSMMVNPGQGKALEVMYGGVSKPAFKEKIVSFFSRLENEFPWLKDSSVELNTRNTFPHGAGIASSASAMSALALCILDVDDQLKGKSIRDRVWWSHASQIARLGSGSACRSVFPAAALWGEVENIPESSNDFALPWLSNIHPYYTTFEDTILIVSDKEKSVSSTRGHQLMENHPYSQVRYQTANANMISLISAMTDSAHIDSFISIVESEALQLHALMMSGPDPFLLLHPNTITIIEEVWKFRKENRIPVCFTLDAGPNVHLLYPAADKSTVSSWVDTVLKPYCHLGQIIYDRVGLGPEKIN